MNKRTCWCGSNDSLHFNADYATCAACGTLLSFAGLSDEQLRVVDDEVDFYGKKYWLEHQSSDLGYPNIFERSRSDLAGRNLHWLRTLLQYKSPPAKVLELGCSHGSFVALLKMAGYDASGMEMSPWVVEYAESTFDIPVALGPIENAGSVRDDFDVIVVMDVLEHLASPKETLAAAFNKLKPDGLMMVQMPEFPAVSSFEELQSAHPSFLGMLLPDEHIYLYTRSSVQRLFRELGIQHLNFETPFFPQHDMFFIASRQPIKVLPRQDAERSIQTPKGRFVQALLDQMARIERLEADIMSISSEAEQRLDQIHTLTNLIHAASAAQEPEID